MRSHMNGQLLQRARKVYKALSEEYPSARCTLNLKTPEQFLFANILSPQCTDQIANQVSDSLWEEFGTVGDIADAKIEKIQEVIRPCGMYKVKSKHIKASAQHLRDEHRGALPRTMDELLEFPGIGRKTALVILLEVYGIVEGIIIDTHNIRIARRVGFTDASQADRIEEDLKQIVPREFWRMWSHLMVFHGREYCTARSPKCGECPILEYCDHGKKEQSGNEKEK
jgi:endonuclease III